MSSPCFVDFIHSRSDLPIAVRARHGRAVRRRRIQECAGERQNVRRAIRVFERRLRRFVNYDTASSASRASGAKTQEVRQIRRSLRMSDILAICGINPIWNESSVARMRRHTMESDGFSIAVF